MSAPYDVEKHARAVRARRATLRRMARVRLLRLVPMVDLDEMVGGSLRITASRQEKTDFVVDRAWDEAEVRDVVERLFDEARDEEITQ